MLAQGDGGRNGHRIKAAVGVALFHALLGYAFIEGLGYEIAVTASDNLAIFDISEPPPPPEKAEVPAEPARKAPEGAAAPPSLPSPIVAPPPEIRLEVPPPVTAAPASGASDVAGPGSGSGGEGAGTGSGGQGSGTSGGGTRAQRIRGALAYADLPRSARERSVQGAVSVRFVVRPDGRVADCGVIRSSGDAILDETTCRVIERRFRYRPAFDAEGQRVAETVSTTFQWIPTPRL